MDFHSGNSLPTSYPSFPYSWKLTGGQRAERVHFIFNLPVHLAHIHPPQFFSWWGEGRPSWTEGNRVAICHRPHMAWGKLEGGQPQRAASHRDQLRRGVCIQAVMLGPDYRTLRLWWGWWLFKSSDILKGSRWALSIWKAQCYLSVHALQAPFPNLFSSSQGRVHFLPSFRFQPRSPPPQLAGLGL